MKGKPRATLAPVTDRHCASTGLTTYFLSDLTRAEDSLQHQYTPFLPPQSHPHLTTAHQRSFLGGAGEHSKLESPAWTPMLVIGFCIPSTSHL